MTTLLAALSLCAIPANAWITGDRFLDRTMKPQRRRASH